MTINYNYLNSAIAVEKNYLKKNLHDKDVSYWLVPEEGFEKMPNLA